MSDMTYEQALQTALYPLRDHIWVVAENDGQLNYTASGAFFSRQDALDFIEHQKSLYPDKMFCIEREFWEFTRRLFESRNKVLEEIVEKSKTLNSYESREEGGNDDVLL